MEPPADNNGNTSSNKLALDGGYSGLSSLNGYDPYGRMANPVHSGMGSLGSMAPMYPTNSANGTSPDPGRAATAGLNSMAASMYGLGANSLGHNALTTNSIGTASMNPMEMLHQHPALHQPYAQCKYSIYLYLYLPKCTIVLSVSQ